MKQYGADILRIWVVASDYSEDLRIGPEILKHHAEAYRRLRNTLRYLLGALEGFAETERWTRARCRRWSAGCCTGSRSSTARSAAPSTTTTSTATSRRCIISARSICRPSISTCARIRSIATGPMRRAGAPAGRCWIISSPA
jgi:Isoleucyl-tRNA synthetase